MNNAVRIEDADRAAVRALVAALPRCDGCDGVRSCGDLATHYGEDGWCPVCEAHAVPGRGALEYASALRVLLARMASWP
jgi:hypothetical protein